MNDLVEKIAEIIKDFRDVLWIDDDTGNDVKDKVLASKIHKAYLADPSICEIDTEAELPKVTSAEAEKYDIEQLNIDFTDIMRGFALMKMREMKDVGWVKPKE